MKKNFLILYEQSYMRGRGITSRALRHANFKRQMFDFTDAPIVAEKEGSKIADEYLMNLIGIDLTNIDGLIILVEGNRFDGRNGVHVRKSRNTRPFSIIQVECHRRMIRRWKKKKDQTWELEMLRAKKRKEDYDQIEYTFEHEIAHALCWLNDKPDTLHAFVKHRAYELWWNLYEGTV